ncbi:serine/threonine-protein kinase TOR isoform X4 [Hevea brasiliensis]|uniref:serine/threonine-protein kinase TOR isoform X4 n=1 Tax=Hevea brasiliensis TaxID=3981 RepID=UPI0025DC44DB|nr:serine/threonine-protein kinase TOR isoform X4 [Hevea brasiliensis]
MASTSQSLRFLGPASAGPGGGSFDALNRIIADLCTRGNPKEGTVLALRKHLEEEARDLSGEAFSRFMDQLYERISSLLESNEVAENLGALRAIGELIDVALGENASKVSKFSIYMRNVFEVKRDRDVLTLASRVLGHLARAGGAMTADEVEFQIKMALDWLRNDRAEYRLFAAVSILKEMAENASTVFNVHVPEFVDAIWIALRHPTLEVRERAVEALRACLRVIEKRETRWRVQWYYRMFEATQDGLGKNAPVHSIHGSLLAVGELLRNTGEFMMSRYREVAEIVLRYLEHRDRLVRLSITSLLPRIAHFLRDRFVTNYLTICMNHILAVLRLPAERGSGFIALGEMAGALDGELVNYLPTIMSHIRDAIAPRRDRPSLEALACVGNIAKAMGTVMEPYVRNLLEVMFSAGLSSTLVEALEQITLSIPSLLPSIQDRLLDSISLVLSKYPYSQARPAAPMARGSAMNAPQKVSDLSVSALVQLALQTLARFNFKGHDLLEFARESVVVYLDDEDGGTRKDAALCCCKLIANSFSGITSTQFSANRSNRPGGKQRRLIEELVEKLLIAAVADADVTVRHSIFSSLHGNRGFDDYLAQANSLSAVFAALNDEDFDVREYAISVVGRLSEKNPAYVLPALRRHLIQLLTYLDQSSADNKCREESAKLLGCLIRNCERLIIPYIAPIHKALVARLIEGTGVNANNGIISGVLVTVGDLARVGGFATRQYIPELMPLIVDALLDGAAATKREVAVATLGQVVQSTGYVITPYSEYPQLLGLLLKLLNGELMWSTRREVLKVLGIMGALDPHAHKRNQQNLPGSHGEVAHAASDSGQHIPSVDDLPLDIWPSFATSEDYYSTVAINSLRRILRDSSLSNYHQKVVGSLMFIFKSMGLGCVPYLPKVLPDLFHTVRTCDDYLRDFITWKLGTLVSIVRQHIRKYLPELLSLVSELWSSFSLPATNRPARGFPVLHLVEQLCLALNDEFRTHLPIILPCCIQVLSDAERCNDYTYVLDILHTLEVFGGTLDEHMHLLLPALIRLFKVDASVDIRRSAIKTLTRLIPRVQVTGHISALVHHLKLVLDGKNDEIRKDAVDALCCLAHALGEDFTIFIPSIHKLLLKHRLRHKEFEEIEGRLRKREPLILASTAVQRLNRRLPVEVISDPLNDMDNDPYEDGTDLQIQLRHQVNDGRLRTAGEASQRSTKEDWAEWMRHFSIELLKESPSPALRTCARLAQLQPLVGRELFAAGFVSCWAQLSEGSQKQLVRSLEMAFSSPNIPPEILAALLNLAEFMEHDEKPLPIDIRLLGALAEKCHAFAKALHYKEMEFVGAQSKKTDANPVAVVEALIHINNQLHQHEAAVGILTYAQQHLDVKLKESWYEKLQRWDDALKAYTAKVAQASSPHLVLEATLGRMRCLAALARWEELNNLCKDFWTPAEPAARLEMAPMAASAAWNMGEWDQMAEYVSRLDDGDETKLRGLGNTATSGDGSSSGTFFRAVLLVRRGKYDEAREYVERARKCLGTELAALVLESYERAYSNMVRVQQLSELEEVIEYWTLPVGNPVAEGRRALIRNMWTERIQGAKRNVEDILRLLTLWFNHGATAEVQMALQNGFAHVNINTWLVVLPQIIARIHSNNHAVRELIQSLLVRIGQSHPQALMYPLLVACKSISNLRRAAAQEVVDKVRQHSGVLVDQAQLVSKELIRVAILWHEMWHEGLEEASRLYFGEHNIEGMLKVLEPLHEMLEEGAMRENTTIKERAFIEAYRHELLEAWECCMKYRRTIKEAELTQAWDLYYHVFRRIDKQLQSLTTLDLQSVSPELLECRNLELAVPGTYLADSPVVTIASFARQLVVITSKQRPRKLTIHGSDGEDYAFLLKGHEDLRQDERVMQLFGLVNTLLENSRKTSEKDLSIQRYAVIPLSPNSGLIGWVPNCDTLHQLIREYRDARKITLNQEHKYMLSFAPDYDHLPLIAKVEVFDFALQNTEGNDLARVLWLKSRTSEVWLERRTNYTRSLAVMSMVGYLLGLGDRHPSNLMLHRYSGKILHIDFGDCFEASMNREKFPEKVPFRLTRMLVKAMEVSGIEGNFRSTCENVMQVLRTNKDSVMAMMEAFVHDPLINWRLFNFNEVPQMSMFGNTHTSAVVNAEESAPSRELPQPQRSARERELLQAVNLLGDANEVLNERAVVVMARMSNKLTGRDFSPSSSVSSLSIQHAVDHSSLILGDSREVDHGLSVKLQVQKLIIQATSQENLCQNYVGWCPFW